MDATRSTRDVAEAWFEALTSGQIERALGLMAPDVEFISHKPVPGINDEMAWIGTFRGRDAVRESFTIFLGLCEVQSEKLVALFVDGDEALGIIHERTLVTATGMEFETEFVQRLTVRDGRIVRWKTYDDPCGILRALRGPVNDANGR